MVNKGEQVKGNLFCNFKIIAELGIKISTALDSQLFITMNPNYCKIFPFTCFLTFLVATTILVNLQMAL